MLKKSLDLMPVFLVPPIDEITTLDDDLIEKRLSIAKDVSISPYLA